MKTFIVKGVKCVEIETMFQVMQETKLTVFSTQECTKRAHEAGPRTFYPRI
jgi:hypothetical protein